MSESSIQKTEGSGIGFSRNGYVSFPGNPEYTDSQIEEAMKMARSIMLTNDDIAEKTIMLGDLLVPMHSSKKYRALNPDYTCFEDFLQEIGVSARTAYRAIYFRKDIIDKFGIDDISMLKCLSTDKMDALTTFSKRGLIKDKQEFAELVELSKSYKDSDFAIYLKDSLSPKPELPPVTDASFTPANKILSDNPMLSHDVDMEPADVVEDQDSEFLPASNSFHVSAAAEESGSGYSIPSMLGNKIEDEIRFTENILKEMGVEEGRAYKLVPMTISEYNNFVESGQDKVVMAPVKVGLFNFESSPVFVIRSQK